MQPPPAAGRHGLALVSEHNLAETLHRALLRRFLSHLGAGGLWECSARDLHRQGGQKAAAGYDSEVHSDLTARTRRNVHTAARRGARAARNYLERMSPPLLAPLALVLSPRPVEPRAHCRNA